MIEANASNFTELTSSGDVLVQFHAAWCGPCKMLSPVLKEIAEENESIKIVRVDVESERDLAIEHGVMGIPTLSLMRNGKLISEKNGFMPKETIENWIHSSLEWRDR
jgi:thioredoxin 1